VALHALNYLPALHRKMHHLTGRYFFTVSDAEFSAYSFHVRHFKGGRALEFGSGPHLLAPLLLSAAGATEVLTYDLNRLASIEQINHVIRQLRGRVASEWPEIESFADLERLYRVKYLAPADVRNTGLPARSVDFIFSTSVLEHVPTDQIREILRECERLAKPDARLSFIIDYHDHYSTADPSIPRFNFYRYGSAWRLFNPGNHYQNRLRHSDYIRLFNRFDVVSERIPCDGGLPETLSPMFRSYSNEDLTALNGLFVLHKPTIPVGTNQGLFVDQKVKQFTPLC